MAPNLTDRKCHSVIGLINFVFFFANVKSKTTQIAHAHKTIMILNLNFISLKRKKTIRTSVQSKRNALCLILNGRNCHRQRYSMIYHLLHVKRARVTHQIRCGWYFAKREFKEDTRCFALLLLRAMVVNDVLVAVFFFMFVSSFMYPNPLFIDSMEFVLK